MEQEKKEKKEERKSTAQKIREQSHAEDLVDKTIEDSFPASDPPAYMNPKKDLSKEGSHKGEKEQKAS